MISAGIFRLTFDRPVAVVGDIHGRADLLRGLLARLPPDVPLLTAGDVCDRGPDTKDVLDLLVARRAMGVLGNHDLWLLAWARREGFDTSALSPLMNGQATLASYGVVGRTARDVEAQAWRVPEAHRQWLEGLALAVDLEVRGEPFWVLHAGIPSTESLTGLRADQVVPHLVCHSPESLLWSATDPDAMLPVDKPVIMGHTARRHPLDAGHVIALDTGAGTRPDGHLTAVVLPARRFLTVG